MGQALNAIIARGFNLHPLDPGAHMRSARDNRRVVDSNLASADVSRQINQFNLGQSQKAAADREALSTLIPELLSLPKQSADIGAAQTESFGNLMESMGRFEPATETTPQRGVNPALLDRAVEMLQRPADELSDRQTQVINEIIKRSPEVQGLVLGQQFAPAQTEWVDIEAPPGSPPGTLWQQNLKTGEKRRRGSGQTINVNASDGPDLLSKEQTKTFVEEGKEFRDAARDAQDMLALGEEFRRLNSMVETGVLAQPELAVNQFFEAIGLGPITDQNIGAAEALQGRTLDFVMMQVAKTKGAVSNKEMNLFERGAPGLSKTPAGNAIMLNFSDKMARRQIEVNELRNQFIGGLTDPADRQNALALWNQELDAWHDANPFFSDDERTALEAASGLLSDFGSAEGANEGEVRKNDAGVMIQAIRNADGELRWLKIK